MDRRKKKDFWANLLLCLNILAVMLFICILLIFHRAQPEFETLFDRFYKLHLRTEWDTQYLYYLVYTVIGAIFISISGLVLGVVRARRQTDHKKALIVTGILSLIMLWVSLNYL